MSKPERVVSTTSGIVAMCLTAIAVMAFGTLFSVSYKSECTRDDKGSRSCTDKLEFLGWSGLPLQPIASAVGIGAGMFVVYARAKNPSGVIELLANHTEYGGGVFGENHSSQNTPSKKMGERLNPTDTPLDLTDSSKNVPPFLSDICGGILPPQNRAPASPPKDDSTP